MVNRKLDYWEVKNTILNWLLDQKARACVDCFVVGISGGVDSALVSTLCAMTSTKTIGVIMPIYSKHEEVIRAIHHGQWLKDQYENFDYRVESLEDVFFPFEERPLSALALANTKSRLRMVMLYALANSYNGLVVGTGNLVEDFGVGFFTKYGDGGIDISPIGQLYKSEVYELAKNVGVNDEILRAVPTDGLWDDGRVDTTQLGISYNKLEHCMEYTCGECDDNLPDKDDLRKYLELHAKSQHKMEMPPICDIKNCIKGEGK